MPIETPVDDDLNALARGTEQGRDRKCRARHGKRGVLHPTAENGLEHHDYAEVGSAEERGEKPVDKGALMMRSMS